MILFIIEENFMSIEKSIIDQMIELGKIKS